MNAAIDLIRAAKLVQAIPYLCAARDLATDSTTEQPFTTVVQMLETDAARSAEEGDGLRQTLLQDFLRALKPGLLVAPRPAAPQRADAQTQRALALLGSGDLDGAAGHCLAAQALDPRSVGVADGRSQIAAALFQRHQATASEVPTPESTFALGLAAQLEPSDRHLKALAAEMLALEDFPLVLKLCERLSEAPLSLPDGFELWRMRRTAALRLAGKSAEAARTAIDQEAPDRLARFGDAASLDLETLQFRLSRYYALERFREALDDTREILRRPNAPDWVAWNFSAYVRNILHPLAPRAIDAVVASLPEGSPELLVAFGMAWTMGAVEQALTLADRLTAEQPQLSAFRPLRAMAMDQGFEPALVLGEPAREGRRIYLSLPCWGARFIDLMERAALGSLLAPGNLPALAKRASLILEIFATPDDLAQLRASETLRRVSGYCETRVFLFPAAIASQARSAPYIFYGCASHATLLKAEREGADMIFLYPDVIYADGCLQSIANRLTNAPYAIFADTLNSYAKPVLDRLAGDDRSGVLAVGSATLIDTAIQHLSKRTLNGLYHPGNRSVSTDPNRILFKTERGLRMHSFVMGPTYVSHAGFAPLILKNFATADGLFTSHLLYKLADDQIEVLSTEDLCVVEVADGDGQLFPLTDRALEEAIPAYFRDNGLNARRFKLFDRPTLYPGATPPEGPVTSEAEMAERLESLRRLRATHPVFVDLSAERDRFILPAYRT